jgi:hypothetical protein
LRKGGEMRKNCIVCGFVIFVFLTGLVTGVAIGPSTPTPEVFASTNKAPTEEITPDEPQSFEVVKYEPKKNFDACVEAQVLARLDEVLPSKLREALPKYLEKLQGKFPGGKFPAGAIMKVDKYTGELEPMFDDDLYSQDQYYASRGIGPSVDDALKYPRGDEFFHGGEEFYQEWRKYPSESVALSKEFNPERVPLNALQIKRVSLELSKFDVRADEAWLKHMNAVDRILRANHPDNAEYPYGVNVKPIHLEPTNERIRVTRFTEEAVLGYTIERTEPGVQELFEYYEELGKFTKERVDALRALFEEFASDD